MLDIDELRESDGLDDKVSGEGLASSDEFPELEAETGLDIEESGVTSSPMEVFCFTVYISNYCIIVLPKVSTCIQMHVITCTYFFCLPMCLMYYE